MIKSHILLTNPIIYIRIIDMNYIYIMLVKYTEGGDFFVQ